jgi:FAD:protein FMN transferase
MKQTRILMDMPVTIEVVDQSVTPEDIDRIYQYFTYIDTTFSTFKEDSEISRINRKELLEHDYSDDMKTIFSLAQKTKQETRGYFDIDRDGGIDPSGIVKGWAIYKAATVLEKRGFKNYYVDAGGDIQTSGKNAEGNFWRIGIRNPFNRNENVKVIHVSTAGVATSGTYIRGQHIYNPHNKNQDITDVVSLTVIGPNIYEADRFATAAFAMGKKGIEFIEELRGFEGYMIAKDGIATYTSGFDTYT